LDLGTKCNGCGTFKAFRAYVFDRQTEKQQTYAPPDTNTDNKFPHQKATKMTAIEKDTASIFGRHLPLIISLVSILLTIVGLHFLPVADQRYLLEEGGPFENATVVGLGICILLICVNWPWREIRSRWYFSALIALFAMRELDLDKSQFTVGLLKSRQYIGDLVALPERLLSLAIIALILAVIISILMKESRKFFVGISMGQQSATAVMFGIVFIFIAKLFDGLGRKLAGFNIDISEAMNRSAYIIEEVAEFGIPITFGIAILTSCSRSVANGKG
jgi:hypothetical protein